MTEQPKMKFEHADKRETEVAIEEGPKIGSGSYGEVFEVKVKIGAREVPFVLKKFKDNDVGSPAFNAERSFENYKAARAAGLKVFPTYRLSDNHDSILMTDGRTNHWFCVSTNNEKGPVQKVERIDNLQEILAAFEQQANLANQHGLYIPDDSIFFAADEETHTKIDFYLADFDLVVRSLHKPITEAQSGNLRNLLTALFLFIESHTPEPESYQEQIDSFLDKLQNQR